MTEQATTAELHQELTSGQIEMMRRRAQVDLYFLSKVVLGYDQLCPQTHGALCNFMVKTQFDERRMVLMPRGFLKSTICTISDSIRHAICDPNTRILIINEVEENAIGFLKELKNHWTGDGWLPRLFPELLPDRVAGPGSDWAQSAASVKRPTQRKESTWTAMGVGGSAMSKHFGRIKCDDLVGRRAKGSAQEMQNTTAWTKDAPSLLDRLEDPLEFIGTRKAIGDTYEVMMERWPDMLVFIMEPFGKDGETNFPKISTRSLRGFMVESPEEWAHDYMNNPIGEGGTDWDANLVQYFELVGRSVQFIDVLTGKKKSWRLHELDTVIAVDPNSGKKHAPDKAAIVVKGTSPDREEFVLSSRSERWSPEELISETFADCKKWNPRVVGIEEAGQQNTIFYFELRCMKEQQYFTIQPLKHKNKEKEQRIRNGLDTPLKSRLLYFLRSQTTVVGQVQMFPQLQEHNKDEIDALASSSQLGREGLAEKEAQEAVEAERKILARRGVTGYGDSCHRSTSLTLVR